MRKLYYFSDGEDGMYAEVLRRNDEGAYTEHNGRGDREACAGGQC